MVEGIRNNTPPRVPPHDYAWKCTRWSAPSSEFTSCSLAILRKRCENATYGYSPFWAPRSGIAISSRSPTAAAALSSVAATRKPSRSPSGQVLAGYVFVGLGGLDRVLDGGPLSYRQTAGAPMTYAVTPFGPPSRHLQARASLLELWSVELWHFLLKPSKGKRRNLML
jgi:hypothetical protein